VVFHPRILWPGIIPYQRLPSLGCTCSPFALYRIGDQGILSTETSHFVQCPIAIRVTHLIADTKSMRKITFLGPLNALENTTRRGPLVAVDETALIVAYGGSTASQRLAVRNFFYRLLQPLPIWVRKSIIDMVSTSPRLLVRSSQSCHWTFTSSIIRILQLWLEAAVTALSEGASRLEACCKYHERGASR
jgi:hypothetical protein